MLDVERKLLSLTLPPPNEKAQHNWKKRGKFAQTGEITIFY